ncbi:MAG: hypothetical protein ACOCUS_01790 [Polyangiales bacterium]
MSKERDRARRNRQRFQQLLNELEDQDRDIAELYEAAGVEPEELPDAAPTSGDDRAHVETTPSSLDLQGFVIRG